MIFDYIQNNYRNHLNNIDYEMITEIKNKYTIEEIKQAVKVAKEHNSNSLIYLKRILDDRTFKNGLPEWFDKEYTPEPLTDEDKKEIEEAIECLRDWHPNDFEEWAEAQRKNNGM